MLRVVTVLGLAALIILGSAGWCYAEGIAITEISVLDFGFILGAPDIYRSIDEAVVIIEASVPANLSIQASPLAYVGKEREFRGNPPALDVSYFVTLLGTKSILKPGGWLKFDLQPETHEAYVLEIEGEVTIHKIHDQPAGPYQGTITITVSAS